MKKRVISVLLLMAMLAVFFIPVNAASVEQFTDVKPGAWYYNAVDYATKNGLFSGTNSTTFAPNDGMTRGMFVTVLGRLSKADTSKFSQVRFNDVDSGRYYAPYVEWAATYGIVKGTTDTTFSPNMSITREQIAAILYRFAGQTGNDVSYASEALNAFLDKGNVSNYAVESLKWATSKGIIKGDSGNIRPKKTATRAEVAQMLMNSQSVLVKTEIIAPDPAPQPPTVSQQNALRRAKEYLDVMPFSYSGLIKQLEFEDFSHEDAKYAADHCGADWNEQAKRAAINYLDVLPFSYKGLVIQLEYDGFTNSQATYGADHCGANWNEQAARAAKNYLSVMSFSRDRLIAQLEYDGFTHEQAVYGVEANGL